MLVAAGFPRSRMLTVLNRCDAPGLDLATIAAELGGQPEILLPVDQDLTLRADAAGLPVVSADPAAPLSRGLASLADRIAEPAAARTA